MITAIILLLAIWILSWAVAYGLGKLASHIAGCPREDGTDLLLSPWMGVACVVALLQIWHFFAPIDKWPLLVVSVTGLLSCALIGKQQIARLPEVARTYPIATAISCALVAWLANRSLNTQEYTDHGLYYMNAIRWTTDYHLVPGLANLHNRFGFNNSNFLLHALLEVGGLRGYSAHLVNGFLAALTVPIVVRGFRSFVASSDAERNLSWFLLALAMIVAISAADRRISSAHGDFAAALLVTVAAWRLLVIQTSALDSDRGNLRYNLLVIALLATTAVTFKTTVIFFAGLAGVALVVAIYRREVQRSDAPLRATLGALFFMLPWCLLLFLPWIGRGYMLSGYPLFPATVAGAPVDWLYPADQAQELREVIYAWARTYYGNRELGMQPGWAWVRPWVVQVAILRAPLEVAIPAVLSFACAAVLLVSKLNALRSNKHKPAQTDEDVTISGAWLLAIAYAISIVAWFLTSPSPRMGSFALWGLTGTMLVLASKTFIGSFVERHPWWALSAVIGLILLPMADESVRIETRYRHNPRMAEYGQHFYHYQPLVVPTWTSLFPPKPTGQLVKKTSRFGVEVYLGEVKYPNGELDLVWDSPLPAAQTLNPDLEARQPGDMQSGFRTTVNNSDAEKVDDGSQSN